MHTFIYTCIWQTNTYHLFKVSWSSHPYKLKMRSHGLFYHTACINTCIHTYMLLCSHTNTVLECRWLLWRQCPLWDCGYLLLLNRGQNYNFTKLQMRLKIEIRNFILKLPKKYGLFQITVTFVLLKSCWRCNARCKEQYFVMMVFIY